MGFRWLVLSGWLAFSCLVDGFADGFSLPAPGHNAKQQRQFLGECDPAHSDPAHGDPAHNRRTKQRLTQHLRTRRRSMQLGAMLKRTTRRSSPAAIQQQAQPFPGLRHGHGPLFSTSSAPAPSPTPSSPWPSSSIQSSLNTAYASAGSIRCPFFKRRAADLVDSLAEIIR